MQKIISLFKTIFSLGWRGDFNTLRKLAKRWNSLRFIYSLYIEKHQSYIPLCADISDDVKFPHLSGIYITGGGHIGHQCTIYQRVTIGRIYSGDGQKPGCPKIGNNVFIGAGATILGGISIGNNVKIGAGCIVVDDIPDNATVVMDKPRIILS